MLAFFSGCGNAEATKLVYNTDQYQVYRRLSSMCSNALDDCDIQEIEEELVCVGENISLCIKNENEHSVVVNVQTEDGNSHCFTYCWRTVSDIINTGIKAAYIDINDDDNRDIVIIFSPVRGTMTGPAGAYLFDVANNQEINILDERLYLSQGMLEEVREHLDEPFYKIFPSFSNFDTLNATGTLYVDKAGKLYYETYILNDSLTMEIGRIMLFLTYDKSDEEFMVSEVLYMPLYVEQN